MAISILITYCKVGIWLSYTHAIPHMYLCVYVYLIILIYR